jgi:hypothetical protein
MNHLEASKAEAVAVGGNHTAPAAEFVNVALDRLAAHFQLRREVGGLDDSAGLGIAKGNPDLLQPK